MAKGEPQKYSLDPEEVKESGVRCLGLREEGLGSSWV